MKPPVPALTAVLGRGEVRIRNHGVELDGEAWKFDGESWLEAFRAPVVAGKPITILATVHAAAENGVIVAQGGDRAGYSLYLKDGKLAFSTCVDWKRTTISAGQLLGSEPGEVEAIWKKNGAMILKIGGEVVAEGKAASLIANQPGDSLQIGADLIKPAGEYETPNRFRGVISNFSLKIAR